jgi:hypothetical protein
VTDDLAFVKGLRPRVELNVTSFQEANLKRLPDQLTSHRNACRTGTDYAYIRDDFFISGEFVQIL